MNYLTDPGYFMCKVVRLKLQNIFLHISGIAVEMITWNHDGYFIRHGHDYTSVDHSVGHTK